MNFSLVAGLVALVLWIIFGFIVPVGAGWIHLLLPLALVLLTRRIVTGREAR